MIGDPLHASLLRGLHRYVLAAILMAAGGSCMAQTAVPLTTEHAPCSAILVDCNAPKIPAAAQATLVDPATAADQARRAQMQAEQAQAEQSLQRRSQLEREHPGTIFVFGDHPQSRDESVRAAFAKALGPAPSSDLSSTSSDAVGRRTECINACYGPMCCVTVPSASDPLR
jgi:hypothetical protein